MDLFQYIYETFTEISTIIEVPFIYGCLDPCRNFNATANTDDGSCVYLHEPILAVKLLYMRFPGALNN